MTIKPQVLLFKTKLKVAGWGLGKTWQAWALPKNAGKNGWVKIAEFLRP